MPGCQTPTTREEVVDGNEHESGVYAIQKALNQPQAEATKGQPLESGQHRFQNFGVMQALRHDQSVDDAQDETKSGENSQRPTHDFDIQPCFCSLRFAFVQCDVFARLRFRAAHNLDRTLGM